MSERQEGEEKAIMKNLRLKEVSIKDLDQIRALYWTQSELMCQHRNCMKNTALLVAEQHRSTMKVPEKQNSYFTNMYWRSSSYI